MTKRNMWKEQQEEARLWHEEVSWVGKIAYIVLVVVLPVAAYILRVWLESHTAHN